MAKMIACLGSSEGDSDHPAYKAMVEVGRLLAERKVTVATGGFSGIGMEAPARGAREAGGQTVGYTMWGLEGNKFLTQTRDMHRTTGGPEREFTRRLGHLMEADGFILAADRCGPGTIMELLAIVNLNFKLWVPNRVSKRFAIIQKDVVTVGDWSKSVCTAMAALTGNPMIWSHVEPLQLLTSSPQSAVEWVLWENDFQPIPKDVCARLDA